MKDVLKFQTVCGIVKSSSPGLPSILRGVICNEVRGLPRAERRPMVLVGLEGDEKPGVGCWFSLFGFEVRNLPLLFQRILDAESKLANSTACHSMHQRI